MGTHVCTLAAVLLAATLIGCGRSEVAPLVEAKAIVAEVATPAVVAVRDVVDSVAPAAAAPVSTIDPDAIALIVRFEVTSPAFYDTRLQMPIWPGASSGVTWGVGYDGGHQTRDRIAGDWHMHAQVKRLMETSGIMGPAARALLPGLRDIRTPFTLAERVFAVATLPAYDALTARTFRNGWDTLHPRARGALTATVYNRGASMSGDRRREMRVLRDECVPAHDYACMGMQFRAMTRLWAGTPVEAGLRKRYEATARLAESAVGA